MKLEVVQHTTGQLSRAKFSPDWRKWLGINTPNVNIRSKSPFFDGFLTHIGDSIHVCISCISITMKFSNEAYTLSRLSYANLGVGMGCGWPFSRGCRDWWSPLVFPSLSNCNH